MFNKILVVGPSWVGDMVMAQCLFKLLKENNPNTVIDVLAPDWSRPILSRMPEVSSIFSISIGHGKLKLKERYNLGVKFRSKRYDKAIILPNSFKSALITWFARIPIRTGWMREMRYGLLNDYRKLDKEKYPLMIHRFMALGLMPYEKLDLKFLMPKLRVSPQKQLDSLSKFKLNIEKPILAICPGAEFGQAKRWPEKYYADIANFKLKQGFSVWIFGSSNDSSIAGSIMAMTNNHCIDLTGKTNLEEAIDLLALADKVLTNDSGLMHIAAALDRDLIVLYGPTTSSFTPPLTKKAKILTLGLSCQPCFKRVCPLKHNNCMINLTPEKVLAQI
ncbi:lipopolysaccharide heptosyltransferase II [Gammaproteobacteria bacterium]|nr:lipopolysaccharide heptosyltransferase II [Gammaproteobacteria bacterium]